MRTVSHVQTNENFMYVFLKNRISKSHDQVDA
jgi:hypothetical protein